MKRSFYFAFAFLAWIGCFHVANMTVTVPLMAQETQVSEEPKKERGYYMPTRITVVYDDEKVIAQEGIPEWMTEAIKVIRKYYPLYDKYLETEGHVPSGTIELKAQSTGPIGWNSNTTMGYNIDYIKPGAGGNQDWGMVAHELVHFVQNYRGGEGTGIPGWATEGIGDFVRHAFFEPEKPLRVVDPNRGSGGRNAPSYLDQYQITAGFFMYIMEHYDMEFIRKLNEMGRKRTYSPDLFEQSSGKKLDDLWAEYAEKILVPHHRENKQMVPATLYPNLMKHVEEFKEHFATLKEEPRPDRPQPQGGQGGGQGRRPRPQTE